MADPTKEERERLRERIAEALHPRHAIGVEARKLLALLDALDAAEATAGKCERHLAKMLNAAVVAQEERDAAIARAEAAEAERDRLRRALVGLLGSADCSWEERGGGHDWPEAVREARAVLHDIKVGEVRRARLDRENLCLRCGEPPAYAGARYCGAACAAEDGA